MHSSVKADCVAAAMLELFAKVRIKKVANLKIVQ